jgi:hypothetical protein
MREVRRLHSTLAKGSSPAVVKRRSMVSPVPIISVLMIDLRLVARASRRQRRRRRAAAPIIDAAAAVSTRSGRFSGFLQALAWSTNEPRARSGRVSVRDLRSREGTEDEALPSAREMRKDAAQYQIV